MKILVQYKTVLVIIFLLLSQLPRTVDARTIEGEYDVDPLLFQKMSWRSIGPFRGGRVTAVAGVSSRPREYYMGATGGGVWKTEDGGLNWTCVSDGYFKTGCVGAIAVSEWDPNVVYVGMGEVPIRGNVSHGDGVYKSLDSGKTWKQMGLEDTRHISRIRVHPRDHNLVYAAALGHVYGPNSQRGVFRSSNGGATWDKILFRSEEAGAIDLAMDPNNPRILYAAVWEAGRTPFSLSSGGPGSGLFKTTDGGDSWVEISRNPGLPKNVLGKIGVAVSPAQPDRVWAIVEAKDGGVFCSENGGETWRKMNDDRNLRQRAWYYSRIYADPKDPETMYVLNTGFYRSVDRGRTFSSIRVPHGDNHDLWIDPEDPGRMINSNDGGANVSANGGESWTAQDNQPTAQFYHVTTDNHFPYRVYGSQQDNSTVRIAGRTTGRGIDKPDWHPVGGGESGHIAPRHDNPDIVFAGSYGGLITRWDYKTGQSRIISAWPENPMGWGAGDLKYRFQWTAPIVVSRFDSNVLYHAAQVLFKTTNEGQSWEVISPDLTTNDKSKQQKSGGPITFDDTSVEYYCTIFALAESFHDPDILWAGSDDGLVHITKDGGKSWNNITPKQLPQWSLISMIEVSVFDPAVAYLAVDRHELDDFDPLIYKTSDFGRSWKKITRGLPDGDFVRVVREDPQRQGLLYAGTETGVFVSFNDGGDWQPLQLNLPAVPIHDMTIKDSDLIAATHGRSFWILDDLTPLHQITDEVEGSDFYLFKPRDANRMGGSSRPQPNAGQNPPSGSVIYFTFKTFPEGKVTLDFMDAGGEVIRSCQVKKGDVDKSRAVPSFFRSSGSGPDTITAGPGMNRFVWDMRYPGAERVPGAILWGGNLSGPTAVPGTYRVRLTVGDKSVTQKWEWKKDPRLETTQKDFREQFDFLIRIRDRVTEVNKAIIRLRAVKSQIDALGSRIKGHDKAADLIKAGEELKNKLQAVEDVLIQSKSRSGQDPLNYPILLDNKIAALASVVGASDSRPTDQSYAVFEELSAKAGEQLALLEAILAKDLKEFNTLMSGIPAVFIK
jgi:photosystem II stability/assembly factor-like uncharacterized protein